MADKNWKIETKVIQAGYEPKNGEPRVVPIVQSTTYKYNDAQSVADLFDLKAEGFFYTRLANPTVDALEKKIAAMEGGVAAVAVNAGQTANAHAIQNIARCGDHVVAVASLADVSCVVLSEGVTMENDVLETAKEKGINILDGTGSDNVKLQKLSNMVKFMKNTCITVKHAKELYLLRQRLNFESDREKLDEIINSMEEILLKEKENVLATIPLVQCDSILGWEHSMEYVGDEPCLRWKLRQLDYELNCNLKDYRTANSLVDIYENKE
jgi:hypothetical protein